MSIDELRDALTILAQDDPDFLRSLIGDVIKDSLSLDSASNGDYYNPTTIPVLKWRSGPYDNHEFSRVY